MATRIEALARRDRGLIGSLLRVPARDRRWLIVGAAAAVVSLVALSWVIAVWATGMTSGPAPASQAAFEEQTGVRVVRVALTGRGGLVDLRYLVIDPQKAQSVHESLYLLDEDSGEMIDTLFMGHEHSGDPKAGYTYPVLFVNEQGLVEQGGRVTLVVAGSRLEHLTVQ